MKDRAILYHLEIAEEQRMGDAIYRLLRLTDGELLKFAVEISDHAGRDLALLHGRESDCHSFFAQIVRGELSSIQLGEVAEDFSRGYAPEFF